MMMVHVRSFHFDDEKQVVALWKTCGLIVPQNDPQQDIRRKMAFQPDLLLVAVHRDRIVGTVMAGYDGHRGWINYLAVDPLYQKKGIGRLLMEHAEERLQLLDCPKINLQVRAANHRVTGFYKHLDYQMEDVMNMGKRLAESTDHTNG